MQPKFTPTTVSRERLKSSHWAGIAGGFAATVVSTACGLYFMSTDGALKGAQSAVHLTSQATSASLAGGGSSVTVDEVSALAASLVASEELMQGADMAAYAATSGARAAYGTINTALSAARVAFSPLEQGQSAARQLRSALLSKAATIQQLMTRLEPGRASANGSSAFESISRLQGYTFSGFGPEAAGRLEYDLANLAYQLKDSGSRDLRAAAEDLYKSTSPLVLALKNAQVTGGRLADVVEQLKSLSAYATQAEAEFSRARTFTTAGIYLSGLGLVAGLVSMLLGLAAVISELGSRVRAATMATRKEELALVKLASDAKALADGNLNIEPTGTDDVTRGLAESLSRIGLQLQRTQARAKQLAITACARSTSVFKSSQAVFEELASLRAGLADVGGAARDMGSNLQWVVVDVGAAQAQLNDIGDELSRCHRAVQDVVDRHDAIRSSVQEGNKRLKHLGEASQGVSMRVEDLASLCEHAQVVSMNAGLEAERAGQHGRGFRLIAGDLRTLSLKLEGASRQAMEAISVMQANARGASEAMEAAAQRVISGTYVADVAASLTSSARHDTESLLHSLRVVEGYAGNEQAAATNIAIHLDERTSGADVISGQVDHVRAEAAAAGREFQLAMESIHTQG